MNVLFLDFDGVLKSIRSSIAFKDLNNMLGTSLAGSCKYPVDLTKRESFNLDPICLLFIRNLVEQYDFKIVISSTWRVYSCIDHFYQMFDLYGWDTRDIVIGFTPHSRSACRGEEIAQWITEHPELEDLFYIIVDDNADMLPEQRPYFIQTDMEYGLNYKDVEKIEKLMETRSHDRHNRKP